MFSALTRKSFYSLLGFSLVFSAGLTRADDTEIYFSGGSATSTTPAAIRPNVLFILDTSGSMTSTVSGTGGESRVQIMKDAVKQVMLRSLDDA